MSENDITKSYVDNNQPPYSTSNIYDNGDIRDDADSITLQRILDTLYFLAIEKNADKAKKLINLHEDGGLLAPPTSFDPSKSLDRAYDVQK